MPRNDNALIIKNAQIRSENLEGREDEYNPAGRRHFSVVIPDDQALQMRDKKWRVRLARDEWLLPVYFEEGSFPGVELSDISGKTLVIYGQRYKVRTTKKLLVGKKAYLSGINEPKDWGTR